ncbi:MAG: bifunctional (p)ppGpp synthetase/guanosine-3',5'-bis(diphosphate) 3'-pyrophosphohydrolase [Bacteroidaceae bacterium]|nr:bifunctional (p)ppGpp synthetase/guanosine-3',5'-bis(diphosphate) 3'-pyrophosphohydrolase [Bacteroidaceae bacterium]
MSDDSLFSPDEEKQIDEAFRHLIDSYLQTKHRKKVEIITNAFMFARQAHKGVRRHSGEPYIMHPLAVAQIVCSEIGLGSTSICSALLHDVVEDTDYTTDDIKNVFGPKIAQIVDGLTKIAGGIFGEKASAQAENFKKLLLTMSDDIRVILIKIADRLHNMRTLDSMLPRKQYKIAGETLYLYAPLAYRLGLNKIKTELEDLSFKYEHPEEYKEIQGKLSVLRGELDIIYDEFTKPIITKLDSLGLNYNITGRIKTPYSIWKKMNKNSLTFEEVFDILAVRIVFEPKTPEQEQSECFDIYLALTKIYKSHPDRFRDWVTHPKANGYQALHVTLMSNSGQWVEVQIRSTRMDDIAEQGIAAHWKYKDGTTYEEDETELDHWLETIKEILEDPQPDSMDFLDTIKLNLYSSEIFIFTPKGELRTMPQGSTVLDFAFTIHTFMGTHCIGAKVNHKLEAVNYELQSGDQVEILTSKNQKIVPEWLDFVTTAKARGKIKQLLRKEERSNQKFGEAIFHEFLEKEELESDSDKIERICALHGLTNRESFMIALGQKKIILGDAERNILKGENGSSWYKRFWSSFSSKDKNNAENTEKTSTSNNGIDVRKTLIINDLDSHKYTFASCCHPVPGDSVIGFADETGHITIHKRKCEIANKMKVSKGNSILTVEWNIENSLFPATIYMKGIDSIGMLAKVTEVISRKMNVNMNKLVIESKEGLFEGTISVMVHSLSDLENIQKGLKKIPHITTVVRKEE